MHHLHPDPTPAERAYWKQNVRLVLFLLAIWFSVSYGAGILFAEWLNQFRIPGTGFPVGFWFAQQGSIYVFVALIFVYVFRMNRLDRTYGVGEDDPPGQAAPPRGGPPQPGQGESSGPEGGGDGHGAPEEGR